MAEVLQGATKAQLIEHAKRLQKFTTPGTPPQLPGDLDPTGLDDEPSELAHKHGRGRRTRM